MIRQRFLYCMKYVMNMIIMMAITTMIRQRLLYDNDNAGVHKQVRSTEFNRRNFLRK